MTVTSEAFQATVITIGRLASTVEDTVEEIASLSAKKGHLESKFEAYREGAGGLWKKDVFHLNQEDGDMAAHNEDRNQICDDLSGAFKVRFVSSLEDKRVKALSIFDRRNWPAAEGELDNYGISQLMYLMDN